MTHSTANFASPSRPACFKAESDQGRIEFSMSYINVEQSSVTLQSEPPVHSSTQIATCKHTGSLPSLTLLTSFHFNLSLCSRVHIRPQCVSPLRSSPLPHLWSQLLRTRHPADPALHLLTSRIPLSINGNAECKFRPCVNVQLS